MKKYIFLLISIISCMTMEAQELNEAAVVVQRQVAAYNARNITAFANTFSDDVVFYQPNQEVSIKGKAQLKELFGNMFQTLPNLYCFIEERIVSGNTVIDHEKVRFKKGEPAQEFVVMYKVKDGKIAEVHFLKRPQ